MGHKVGKELLEGIEINMEEVLTNKVVCIDAYNLLYKLLSVYRTKNGDYFRSDKGMVTSHLYGISNYVTKLAKFCKNIIFVFDGIPPVLKSDTIKKRSEIKKTARLHLQLLQTSDVVDFATLKKYKVRDVSITPNIVESTKRLLDLMGVASYFAADEAERACVALVNAGFANYIISDDWDFTLYDIPEVIRNFTIKNESVVVTHFDLKSNFNKLGITLEQYRAIAILSGTDYWEGIRGIGPTSALKLVKEWGTNLEEYPDNFRFRKKEYLLHDFKKMYPQIVSYLDEKIPIEAVTYPVKCISSLKYYWLDTCNFGIETVYKLLNIVGE